jgi:hypothetical protein
MALPSEAPEINPFNGIAQNLGKAISIDLQSVSVSVPELNLPVVQRDDGKWAIGWHDDAPGPFETRRHAEAVAT